MSCNERHVNIKQRQRQHLEATGWNEQVLFERGGARELFTFIVMAEINIPQLQAVEDNTCLRQLYSSRNHDPSTLFLPRLVFRPHYYRDLCSKLNFHARIWTIY